MIDWQKQADECKSNLKELDEWIAAEWFSLPKGVKRVISRGQSSLEEKIKKFEEWARKESDKAE